MRRHMIDHLVNGVARLHHQHYAPRFLQQAHQLFYGVRAHNLRALRFICNEVVDFGNSPVKHGHLESMVVHVEDKILSHHSKANQADITRSIGHSFSKTLNSNTANRGSESIVIPWSDLRNTPAEPTQTLNVF